MGEAEDVRSGSGRGSAERPHQPDDGLLHPRVGRSALQAYEGYFDGPRLRLVQRRQTAQFGLRIRLERQAHPEKGLVLGHVGQRLHLCQQDAQPARRVQSLGHAQRQPAHLRRQGHLPLGDAAVRRSG